MTLHLFHKDSVPTVHCTSMYSKCVQLHCPAQYTSMYSPFCTLYINVQQVCTTTLTCTIHIHVQSLLYIVHQYTATTVYNYIALHNTHPCTVPTVQCTSMYNYNCVQLHCPPQYTSMRIGLIDKQITRSVHQAFLQICINLPDIKSSRHLIFQTFNLPDI